MNLQRIKKNENKAIILPVPRVKISPDPIPLSPCNAPPERPVRAAAASDNAPLILPSERHKPNSGPPIGEFFRKKLSVMQNSSCLRQSAALKIVPEMLSDGVVTFSKGVLTAYLKRYSNSTSPRPALEFLLKHNCAASVKDRADIYHFCIEEEPFQTPDTDIMNRLHAFSEMPVNSKEYRISHFLLDRIAKGLKYFTYADLQNELRLSRFCARTDLNTILNYGLVQPIEENLPSCPVIYSICSRLPQAINLKTLKNKSAEYLAAIYNHLPHHDFTNRDCTAYISATAESLSLYIHSYVQRGIVKRIASDDVIQHYCFCISDKDIPEDFKIKYNIKTESGNPPVPIKKPKIACSAGAYHCESA